MSNLTLICRKFFSAFSALAPEVARSDKRTRALPLIKSRRVLIWLSARCQAGISARQVGGISPSRAAADLGHGLIHR